MNKPAASAEVQRRRRPKAQPDAGDGSSERYYSKAIARALDVLECFREPEVALNLKEIALLMQLPESSLFRVLVTLEGRGYLTQTGDGTYRLSQKQLFGRIRERAERLRELARPHLEALARRFDENASLAYLSDDHILVLDSVDSFHEIRHSNRVGRVLPPHCSSMGKAITAFQERPLIDAIVEGYGLFPRTANTITDRGALYQEFERIRQRGYAFDRGEAVEGGLCVGAPVFAANGLVFAAVSISVPNIRVTEGREEALIRGVLESARDIGQALQ